MITILSIQHAYSEEQIKVTICLFLKQTEVILRRQNIPLKCRQPLEILLYIETGLDLSMLKIWDL